MISVWDAYDYVIGVDPGLVLTGMTVMDKTGPLYADHYSSDSSQCLEHRAYNLSMWATSFEEDVNDAAVRNAVLFCIEDNHITRGKSAQTALKQRELIGVMCGMAWRIGCEISRVAPSSAKKALTGSGKASKEQMVDAAMGFSDILYDARSKPKREALADSLGIALSGAHLTLKDIT